MVALICFVLAVLASPFKMANSTSMRSPVARVTQAIGACIVPLPDDTGKKAAHRMLLPIRNSHDRCDRCTRRHP